MMAKFLSETEADLGHQSMTFLILLVFAFYSLLPNEIETMSNSWASLLIALLFQQ